MRRVFVFVLIGWCAAAGAAHGQNPVIDQRRAAAETIFDSIDIGQDGIIDEQEARFSRQRTYRDMDQDRDGFLTPGEYVAFVAEDRLDINRDGRVELRERRGELGVFPPVTYIELQQRIRKDFSRLDRNLDGLVSRQEYLASALWFIARYDRDDDDVVTREEYVGDRTFALAPRVGDNTRWKLRLQQQREYFEQLRKNR